MYKFTFVLFVLSLTCLNVLGQDLHITVYDPPIPITGAFSPNWGTDYIVSNTEPFGKSSGIVRPTDTIYVMVPDTNILPGAGMVLLKSTNNGANWSAAVTVNPASALFTKTKMVRSGLDSIYCFFLFNSGLYVLKISQPISLRPFLGGASGYRDFDGWASSTGGLYLFPDSLTTGAIPRYGSSDGGVTWGQRGVVTNTAANPFVSYPGSGDTILLMYYQGPTAGDTTTSPITVARYRESALGQMSSIAFLTSLISSTQPKAQFGGAKFGNVSWIAYTTGAPGSRDIMVRTSTDGGVTYGSDITVAGSPNVDEYNFDIQHYTIGTSGADFIYYSDSAGTTNTSDRLMYTFANITAPGTFAAALQISEHPPVANATRGYCPFIMEYYNTGGDLGVVWTGLDVANRRVYFDRYNAIVGIHQNQTTIPGEFLLGQNYPNPFNPTTKIEFSLPKDGFVSLKVFDILGRQVSLVVNKNMKAGSYTVDFDASKLSSGVYFYKLVSGNFVQTRKMVLVK